MSFDEIPENKEESYPCPDCNGNVTETSKDVWECDLCSFEYNGEGDTIY